MPRRNRKRKSGNFTNGKKAFECSDIIPKSFIHKLFLICLLVSSLVLIVLTSISVDQARNDNYSSDTYLAITLMIGLLFFLYIGLNGIYQNNRYELYAYLFGLILSTLYIIYRFVVLSDQDRLDGIQYAFIIAIGAIDVLFAIISIPFFRSFGEWRFKNLISALQNDVELREMYRWYEVWVSLLKMDVLFGLIFVLMGLFFFFSPLETVIQLVGICVTFIWAAIGNLAVRLEDKGLVTAFYFISLLMPANIIWKLSYVVDRNRYPDVPLVAVIGSGIVALGIRFILTIVTIKMNSNFGKELRDKVFDPEEEEEPILSVIAETTVKPYLTLTVKKIKGFTSNNHDDDDDSPVANVEMNSPTHEKRYNEEDPEKRGTITDDQPPAYGEYV